MELPPDAVTASGDPGEVASVPEAKSIKAEEHRPPSCRPPTIAPPCASSTKDAPTGAMTSYQPSAPSMTRQKRPVPPPMGPATSTLRTAQGLYIDTSQAAIETNKSNFSTSKHFVFSQRSHRVQLYLDQ